MCGVTLGAYLESDSLEAIAGSWLPVLLVSAGTLALSIAAGWVLARTTELDRPTATLGMIAGGASGIVGMAKDLGGDDRLVAFMQYLRVLIVVLATPLLVTIFGGGEGIGAVPNEDPLATPRDWLITAAVAPTRRARSPAARKIPAGTLLGPMVVAGALTLSGVGFVVPPVVRELAFALIGLQVGLRFTLDTVRQLGRLLFPVLAALVGIMAGCFGLAMILAADDAAVAARLLPGDDPGRHLRRARGGVRREREHHVHPRRPGPAAARRRAARPGRRAAHRPRG